jgi:putative ABC transport system permease protein
VVIPPLRRKAMRDLRRLWAQVLAIALVLAAGVATLILGTGTEASLVETRARYYEANRFADIFANVTRAPRALVAEVAAIDGVLAAEGRIVRLGLLDLEGMAEPGTALLVSLPEGAGGQGGLNLLHLRQGRLPDPQAADEIAISEGFAAAHGFGPGSRIGVLMNGQRRDMRVTGIALSPEFIYALGPGEMMPDPRRFGVFWLPRPALEAAFDLEGAFSNLVVKLAPGASERGVIEAVDRLTAPYGGSGATGRSDQISHAFLEAELRQLDAMVRVLPPIFLAVAAMLVNITLARLVTLEREQIGLLKAIGYTSRAIGQHYVEFVLMIAALGTLIGIITGAWLGSRLAEVYARFFTFPFLVFSRDPRIYALAAVVTALAAAGGALVSVRNIARLPPAVAMTPPAPVSYRGRAGGALMALVQRRTGVMTARHLLNRPLRTVSGILGVAMAVAILVASLWSFGSIERMIEVTFSRAERQDATVVFGAAQPIGALHAARAMPGVLAAEPFRGVEARLSSRNLSRKVGIMGRPSEPRLSRVLDPDLRPMAMPEAGLILSEALADALEVGPGEVVRVEILEGERRILDLPVSGISLGYVGLGAAMDIGALNRILGEDTRLSGVHLLLDPAAQAAFHAAAKAAPRTAFVTVTDLTVARFRQTLAENIVLMVSVYVGLAAIIAIGVVYSFARISLSEQGRELASLRVLGFTRAEVAGVVHAELAAIVILAQPLGWAIGYGLALAMVLAFSSDLYRVPFVVGPDVYAKATLAVAGAAVASAWLVRLRIDRLDLIAVLKTRE